MTKLFHIQNFASAAFGTSTVRLMRESAQSWSAPEYHMLLPLCGWASVITLFGRLTLMPSAVPLGVRLVCPTITSRADLPGPTSTGLAQPSTHLSQRPMCAGIDWKIGPECEPELI